MAGKILEENIIVNALAIFETAQLNLYWIGFFSIVDNVAIFRNSSVKQFVDAIKLKSPNDIDRGGA